MSKYQFGTLIIKILGMLLSQLNLSVNKICLTFNLNLLRFSFQFKFMVPVLLRLQSYLLTVVLHQQLYFHPAHYQITSQPFLSSTNRSKLATEFPTDSRIKVL